MRGDDNITGWSGNDQIYGGPGNDHLEGMGDDDVVQGGSSSDFITGGDAAGGTAFNVDFLFGQSGGDTIQDVCCDGDHDSVCGGTGDDSINVADDDTYDYVYDLDPPIRDVEIVDGEQVSDTWFPRNACGSPEDIDTSVEDYVQAIIDDGPDDILELFLNLLPF